jgi:uncharacterized RDD family membrane protein YckC
MTRSGQPQEVEAGPAKDGMRDASASRDDPDDHGPGPGRAMAGHAVRTSQGLTEGITSTQRIPGPAGYFIADVPNRIMALIIDIIALSLAGLLLVQVFGGLATPPGAFDAPVGELDMAGFVVVFLLMTALSLAYFVYLWTAVRATLGMRLLGLQVGDEARGHNSSARQALLRWLLVGIPSVLVSMVVYVPGLVGFVLGAIGSVWLAVLLYTTARSDSKQGLHDRYAHTVVLKRRRHRA